MEKCCLLLSANESYQRAEEDIKVLTGIGISHSTQQRMVHRQTFELPQVEQEVEEISIDGGKVRLRTPKGKPCQWRDAAHRALPSPSFGLCPKGAAAQSPLGGYEALLRQAANLHDSAIEAFFQDNENLINWVNQQPFSNPLTCLGDGHCGI